MPVVFQKFAFHNKNGVKATLYLEAPIGTEVLKVTVNNGSTYTTNPNLNDIPSVKIKVVAEGHEDYPDIETIGLTGVPYKCFLLALQAESSIGSVHGEAAFKF